MEERCQGERCLGKRCLEFRFGKERWPRVLRLTVAGGFLEGCGSGLAGLGKDLFLEFFQCVSPYIRLPLESIGIDITIDGISDRHVFHGELDDGDDVVLVFIILGNEGKVDLRLDCHELEVFLTTISSGSGCDHVPRPL